MFSCEKRIRAWIAAMLCAAGLQFSIRDFSEYLIVPELAAFFQHLQAGHHARDQKVSVDFAESPPAAPRQTEPVQTETPEEEQPTEPESESEPEAAPVPAISYACDLRPDLQKLLAETVDFGEKPCVLILSTHATESYRKNGEDYEESADYRTLDPQYNMISLGSLVAEHLRQQGVSVIQDTEFHDYPSYNGSYNHARKKIHSYLKEEPDIGLILDLHRDAIDGSASQLRTRAAANGKDSAQLMLVVGTNSSGLTHDNWEQNLALALKLQVKLETLAPGITRPISLRAQRFNQDLSAGAILVEIGAAGNTRQEALTAAEVLAEAVAQLLAD